MRPGWDLVRLQAQHDDLVQSVWLESVLEVDADTPCSSCIRPRHAPVQRDPSIDQLVFVDKRMISGEDCIEVTCIGARARGQPVPSSEAHA